MNSDQGCQAPKTKEQRRDSNKCTALEDLEYNRWEIQAIKKINCLEEPYAISEKCCWKGIGLSAKIHL